MTTWRVGIFPGIENFIIPLVFTLIQSPVESSKFYEGRNFCTPAMERQSRLKLSVFADNVWFSVGITSNEGSGQSFHLCTAKTGLIKDNTFPMDFKTRTARKRTSKLFECVYLDFSESRTLK